MAISLKTVAISSCVIIIIIAIAVPLILFAGKSSNPEPSGKKCQNIQDNVKKLIDEGGKYLDYKEIFDDSWPFYFEDYKVTGHYLNVTSLRYLSENDTNNHIWWHRVIVYIPDDDNLDHSIANSIFFNNGDGDIRDENGNFLSIDELRPVTGVNMFVTLASYTGTVVVDMYDNPNQYLKYFEENANNQDRREDGIIAYSWRHYIEQVINDRSNLSHEPFNPDIENLSWILQIPMTKAVVKTFNAVQDFLLDEIDLKVDSYAISGMSKRGWTSWLTAALDDRVFISLPKVFDLLETQKTLHSHYRALKGWSFAFSPYWYEDLTLYLDDEAFEEMACLIDPSNWLEEYNLSNRSLPIYHTGTTGDEFFLITNANSYLKNFKNLHNNTRIRYLHNMEHSMDGEGLFQYDSIIALRNMYVAAAKGKSHFDKIIPNYAWTTSQNGTYGEIVVWLNAEDTIGDPVLKVYVADTLLHEADPIGKNMDFRLAKLNNDFDLVPSPILWNRSKLTSQAKIEIIPDQKFKWKITMPALENPDQGYRAFYVDIEIDMGEEGGKFLNGREENVLTLSTEAVIMPGDFRNDDCFGEDCYGFLV